MKRLIKTTLAFVMLLMMTASSAATPLSREQSVSYRTDERIRKELVTLPYFGVFDNLAFKREGRTVTLYGQVVRPSTRHDAEWRVRRVAGVERVINQIEVLPLSPFDDRIRARAYRTLFNTGGLYRYALGANPSVHIVVNRGRLTLEGVVANEGDRRLADITARGIPGVFAVTNNLRVENQRAR